MRPAAGLLLLALTACGGGDDAVRGGAPSLSVTGSGPAARLCADVAREYDGDVAAAYDTTVQAVRDHMADPHDTGGDPSLGPVPSAYTYPGGWAAKAPEDAAAACYVDAIVPVSLPFGAPVPDRALVMAAEGVSSFLASAGPEQSLRAAPLALPDRRSGTGESLECGTDKRSVRLVVDYASDAVGSPTPEEAARVLLDEKGLPRDRHTERIAQSPLGSPVLELLDVDGHVVAYVSVDRWSGDTWMATGLTSCQSAYGDG